MSDDKRHTGEDTQISTHISNIIRRLGTGDIESMEDDFLTYEEKRTLKLYENMNAERMLKQILEEEDGTKKGIVTRLSEYIYRWVREYRTEFFLIIVACILFWVFINTGLHTLIPFVESWTLTHVDPFPFKIMSLIISLGSFLLAQLILIAQRREAKATKKKAEFQFILHLEQKINLKVLKHKQDLMQKKMDTLYRVHADILSKIPDISEDIAKRVSTNIVNELQKKR